MMQFAGWPTDDEKLFRWPGREARGAPSLDLASLLL